MAFVDTMCDNSASSGVTQDGNTLPLGTVGTVAAHEMGHNFGFLHDDEIGEL